MLIVEVGAGDEARDRAIINLPRDGQIKEIAPNITNSLPY